MIVEMDSRYRKFIADKMTERIHEAGCAYEFRDSFVSDFGLVDVDENNIPVSWVSCFIDPFSKVMFLGWAAVFPVSGKRKRHDSIVSLFAAIPDYAQNKGAKYIMAFYGQSSINRILSRIGWLSGDNAVEHRLFVL